MSQYIMGNGHIRNPQQNDRQTPVRRHLSNHQLVSVDFVTVLTSTVIYSAIFVSLVLEHMKQASGSYYGTFNPQSIVSSGSLKS